MTAASEFQQVTDSVLFWQAYEPEIKADLCASAVRGRAGWVFIDPIPLVDAALLELSELIQPVAIVLTNGNHARAAAEFRDRFEIPIAAHPDAGAELELSVDEEIGEGAFVAGDLGVITLPGAGPGEIAIHAAGRSLHLGDALINMEAHGLTFLPDKYCLDPKQLRQSLKKLASLEFSTVTFAHGLPLVAQAKARLSQLVA